MINLNNALFKLLHSEGPPGNGPRKKEQRPSPHAKTAPPGNGPRKKEQRPSPHAKTAPPGNGPASKYDKNINKYEDDNSKIDTIYGVSLKDIPDESQGWKIFIRSSTEKKVDYSNTLDI